jgi:metal-responsive CopG/Arc/MetJ family transcriptional regulator
MKKLAITLGDEQAKAIERIRRQRKIPRSRVIQQAVELYLAHTGQLSTIRAYEEGYRRRPEQAETAEGYGRAAAEVLGEEDWK